MRSWFKYYLAYGNPDPKEGCLYENYEAHATAMGGYHGHPAYQSKEAFFDQFFHDFQLGRLEIYDRLIRGMMAKEDRILSLGCGRAANELKLLGEGYDILATDMGRLPALEETLKLFPEFRFRELDILKVASPEEVDGVLSLSLIYLFDDDELKTFFRNVAGTMKEGGYLVLDSAGSPDNLLSFLIHDVLLKMEVGLGWFLMMFFSRQGKPRVVKKHHGYRRRDEEIIDVAKVVGFEFEGQRNDGFLFEFSRSRL